MKKDLLTEVNKIRRMSGLNEVVQDDEIKRWREIIFFSEFESGEFFESLIEELTNYKFYLFNEEFNKMFYYNKMLPDKDIIYLRKMYVGRALYYTFMKGEKKEDSTNLIIKDTELSVLDILKKYDMPCSVNLFCGANLDTNNCSEDDAYEIMLEFLHDDFLFKTRFLPDYDRKRRQFLLNSEVKTLDGFINWIKSGKEPISYFNNDHERYSMFWNHLTDDEKNKINILFKRKSNLPSNLKIYDKGVANNGPDFSIDDIANKYEPETDIYHKTYNTFSNKIWQDK